MKGHSEAWWERNKSQRQRQKLISQLVLSTNYTNHNVQCMGKTPKHTHRDERHSGKKIL